MHSYRSILFVLFSFLCATLPANGQSDNWTTNNGVLHVLEWPESAQNQRSIDSLRVHAAVLPSIDTLSIGYGFRAAPNQPFLTFALEWKPGSYAILDGERIRWNKLKGEVLIESLQLSADVAVNGETVSSLVFVVDSLMLAPYPGLFSEEITTLTWDTVFPNLSDSTARDLFNKGFSLKNPEITRISFVYFDEDGNLARDNPPEIITRRRPSKRTVYGPNIIVDVHVPIIIRRSPPRPRQAEEPRTVEPRGERMGRGDTTDDDRRTRDTDRRTPSDSREPADQTNTDEAEEGGDILDATRKKKKKSDDDEDEDELLPAALAGVAAVAIVAVAGGTVGYYGNTKNAPIGLTAGYVRPTGGVLLQAAVNSAVLERSTSKTEHFLGKITGFYDLFQSPIQPALGFGVMASEDNGDFEYDVVASVGLIGNFGSAILIGGYDLVSGGADIGIAVNFKAKK